MATTIANSRPLMRQKVNVSEGLINHWKKCMDHELRHLIHVPLLTMEDYGKTFEHQERTFEIFGMTENGHMMLREFVEGEPFYWECTRQFVQMKLDRWYHRYEIIGGVKTTVRMDYEMAKFYLPPVKATRKKAVEESEETEENYQTETYVEDVYEENENEN